MVTNQYLKLSSAALKQAATLQARIEQLQAELLKLLGVGHVAVERVATKAGRRPLSAARRKQLSAIAKARWKKVKAAGKTTL